MPRLTARRLTIGLGGVLSLVAVLADRFGLGREPGFGWKQAVVLAIGLSLIAGGAVWGSASR